MHANHCPRNCFGLGLPHFILMGMEIRSRRGLFFYWRNTLLGIMSSSHFIGARVSPVRLERHCISHAKEGYYGAWNEKQMDVWNSSNYKCEGSYTLGKCPQAPQMTGHCAIKNAAFYCAVTIKIHAKVRAGYQDCRAYPQAWCFNKDWQISKQLVKSANGT